MAGLPDSSLSAQCAASRSARATCAKSQPGCPIAIATATSAARGGSSRHCNMMRALHVPRRHKERSQASPAIERGNAIMALETIARVKLLGLSGSLRSNSYCRSVLHTLQRALAPEVALAVRDLRLPLYNEDEDGASASDDV